MYQSKMLWTLLQRCVPQPLLFCTPIDAQCRRVGWSLITCFPSYFLIPLLDDTLRSPVYYFYSATLTSSIPPNFLSLDISRGSLLHVIVLSPPRLPILLLMFSRAIPTARSITCSNTMIVLTDKADVKCSPTQGLIGAVISVFIPRPCQVLKHSKELQ